MAFFRTFQIGIIGMRIEICTQPDNGSTEFTFFQKQTIMGRYNFPQFVGLRPGAKYHVLVLGHRDVLRHFPAPPVVDEFESALVVSIWIGTVATFQQAECIHRSQIQPIHAIGHGHRQMGIEMIPFCGRAPKIVFQLQVVMFAAAERRAPVEEFQIESKHGVRRWPAHFSTID